MTEFDQEPRDDAFLFSYAPLRDRPCNPDAVSHRYTAMCKALGIDSHLHALRHYTATELISAGVDLRAVAGRLGHGGGGATTLRVYTAWVSEADRRAAQILGTRLPAPNESRGISIVSSACAESPKLPPSTNGSILASCNRGEPRTLHGLSRTDVHDPRSPLETSCGVVIMERMALWLPLRPESSAVAEG